MILLATLTACLAPADTYEYGGPLPALQFALYTPDVGVHPDTSILRDPDNPFRFGMDGDTKWQVLEDGPVPAFYAWATNLAIIPTGEHQFYTAQQAHAVYDLELSHPEDAVFVRDIAIRGYQQVLETFPDSQTFDATGRNGFQLAPLAYLGIEDLGGEIPAGWVKIDNPDGSVTVVDTGGAP